MTSSELAVLGSATYQARITPLKTGGRRDMEVTPEGERGAASFAATNIVGQLRAFFAALDAEADQHRGDPVALSQALVRLDALLADVRAVRDSVKALAASALSTERVRRLTVEGVCTVESSTETKRTNWEHQRLLTKLLERNGTRGIHDTGEIMSAHDLADQILEWMRPEWRMTPIKELGINPDDFCTVAVDDDGKPIREATVRIVDNRIRKTTTGDSSDRMD